MGNNGAECIKVSGNDEAECPETTVEIKIKTLDSQTYTLRVDKCVNTFFLYPLFLFIALHMKDVYLLLGSLLFQLWSTFFEIIICLYIPASYLKKIENLHSHLNQKWKCMFLFILNLTKIHSLRFSAWLINDHMEVSVLLSQCVRFTAGSCSCTKGANCYSYWCLVRTATAYMPWKSFERWSTSFSLSYPFCFSLTFEEVLDS